MWPMTDDRISAVVDTLMGKFFFKIRQRLTVFSLHFMTMQRNQYIIRLCFCLSNDLLKSSQISGINASAKAAFVCDFKTIISKSDLIIWYCGSKTRLTIKFVFIID